MNLGGDRRNIEAGVTLRNRGGAEFGVDVATPTKRLDPRVMFRAAWRFGRRPLSKKD